MLLLFIIYTLNLNTYTMKYSKYVSSLVLSYSYLGTIYTLFTSLVAVHTPV